MSMNVSDGKHSISKIKSYAQHKYLVALISGRTAWVPHKHLPPQVPFAPTQFNQFCTQKLRRFVSKTDDKHNFPTEKHLPKIA